MEWTSVRSRREWGRGSLARRTPAATEGARTRASRRKGTVNPPIDLLEGDHQQAGAPRAWNSRGALITKGLDPSMTANDPSGDRRPISKRLRYEVFRRDDYRCRYCGGKAPDVALTVDHVQPVALGGTDEPANLVTACAECNAGKSSSAPDAPIVENVADDALRWAKAMERANEIQEKAAAKDREIHAPIIEAVDEKWCQWTANERTMPRPDDWEARVKGFAQQGLSSEVMVEAVQITMTAKGVYNKNLWRYFCGVCWRKIRERQEIARALIEAEERGSDES